MKCITENNHIRIGYLFTKNNYKIYQCKDCGAIMADVAFNKEQYEKDDYYTVIYKSYKEIDRFWGFRYKYILNILSAFKVRNLLDFGAGNGFFTYLAKEKYKLNADGYEISENEIAFAKNTFNIELKNKWKECANNYDIVTLLNVIEHVPEPKGILCSVLEKIEKDGILVITTPNPNCFQTLLKGLENWKMIMPPHHINLFSKIALIEILHNKGLSIIKYETLGTYFAADFFTKHGTNYQIVRRFVRVLFKILNIGADHFIIAKKNS